MRNTVLGLRGICITVLFPSITVSFSPSREGRLELEVQVRRGCEKCVTDKVIIYSISSVNAEVIGNMLQSGFEHLGHLGEEYNFSQLPNWPFVKDFATGKLTKLKYAENNKNNKIICFPSLNFLQWQNLKFKLRYLFIVNNTFVMWWMH